MQINLSNNLHRIILGLAFLLVFISGFHSTFAALVVQWNGSESAGYSHGFLVLLCSVYLLWLKRNAFLSIRPQPYKLALIPLLLCSLIWFVAKVIEIQSLQMLAVFSMLFFLVPAIFGLAYLKVAFVPLIILLFALPIWQPALPLLQDITTAVTHFSLKLIGRPVFVVDNFVHVSGGSFVIEESCSGLRFLLVAVTLSLVNSAMNFHTWRQTFALLAIATGLSFLANWVRVLAVILIGDFTRMESPLVEDHANLGWVIFMVFVLVPYFIINRRFPLNDPPGLPVEPVINNTLMPGITILGLALMAAGPVLIKLLEYRALENNLIISLPDQVAGMNTNTTANLAVQDWQPDYQNPTDRLFRAYGRNPRLEVHVIHYAKQTQGAELINVQNNIVQSDSWSIVSGSEGTYEIADALATEKVNTLRASNGRGAEKQIWYWYNVGGKATENPVEAKLLQIGQMLQGRSDASLFAIAADCTENCAEGLKRLEQFIREFPVTLETP